MHFTQCICTVTYMHTWMYTVEGNWDGEKTYNIERFGF